MGQFSTYRLNQISSPTLSNRTLDPNFPGLGTNETFRQGKCTQVLSYRPHPKMGMTGVSSCLAGRMDSPLFPFASCAFQAPCWALTGGCSTLQGLFPPPTARSQVPLHFPSSPQSTITQRARGGGPGTGEDPPTFPGRGGTSKALTLTSPPELPSSLPSPTERVSGYTRRWPK